MTFVQHLDELRTRLLRSIVAMLAAVVVSTFFYKGLIDLATLPHYRAMAWVGSGARFILGGFGSVAAVMKLAAIVGFFFASPYVARELWGFVSAGLYRDERRHVAAFAPASFLLFLLGCVFGYFVLVPSALYAMVSMMPLDKVDPVLDLADYLGFVMTMTIVLGLVFQLPLVMVFLSRVGLVAPDRYRALRRHAVLANVVLAAVLSPPDLLGMAVFSLPLIVLYEIGLRCAAWSRTC